MRIRLGTRKSIEKIGMVDVKFRADSSHACGDTRPVGREKSVEEFPLDKSSP